MKAAFTRAYNKEVHLTPYSLQAVKKGRRGGGGESELGGEDADKEVQESEDEGDSLKIDAMIKVRALNGFLNRVHTYLIPSRNFVSLCLHFHIAPVSSPFCSRRRQKQKGSRRRKRRILGRAKAKARGKPRLRNDFDQGDKTNCPDLHPP